MESVFSQLYLDLQKRIKCKVPEIEWIEQDFGQDIYDKWRPNVALPAVLIDFNSANYTEIGGVSQSGDVTVSLRILFAAFSQSYEDAPIDVREDALQFFEIESKLVRSLQGWQPDCYYTQPLLRRSATSQNGNNIGLRIRTLTFSTTFIECFNLKKPIDNTLALKLKR